MILCTHPIHKGALSLLCLYSVRHAILALGANSLDLLAFDHGLQMDVLLIIVGKPVKEVDDSISFIHGHFLETFQSAATVRPRLSSVIESTLLGPVRYTGVQGFLSDVSCPPTKMEYQKTNSRF